MKKKLKQYFKIVPLIILFLLTPQVSSSDVLDDAISGLQKYLNNTSVFRATFVQITQLQSIDDNQSARGEVYIMKPGLMRWEYQKPELQTIIINNRQVWIYTPADNQVIKTGVGSLGTSAIYELFLSNEVKINEKFNISMVRGNKNPEKEGLYLELLPKNTEVNINKIIIELTNDNYQIESFVTYDKLDNITTVKFTDIKRNKGMNASIFNFKVPKGVEVITPEDLGAS